jgi:Xaa-Pro aminopeptidase
MVITIEPGIYIDRQLFDSDHPAVGVGFRIEDDILITASGPEVLSAAAPKKWEQVGAML